MAIAMNEAGDALMLTPEGEWKPTRVAQNPTTGERMAFDGQQWQPIPAGADPRWDARDLAMSGMRGVPVFGGGYERNLSPADQKRAENFDRAHPYMSTAAKFVGGGLATTAALAALPEAGPLAAVAGPVLGASRGGTPLARFAQGMAGGAALGGADAASRGQNPLAGAAIGGVAGGAAPAIARAAEGVITPVRSALSPVNRAAQQFEHVGNAPVHIYGPEAGAGNVEGQMYLDQMRKGTWGERAKAQVLAADAARETQLGAAQTEIRNAAAGGVPTATATPLEAMAQTQQAVQNAAAGAKAGYKGAYGTFDAMPGAINTDAFGNISQGLQNQVAKTQQMFAGPKAQGALDEFEKNLTGGPGISIQETNRALQILKARREALSPITDGYDRTVLGHAIGGFNDHLQNTLASPHFTGDAGALPALQNANQLFARYKQLYGTTGANDPGGKFVQSMLKDNLSYQQMADRLYGSSPKTAGELQQNIAAATRLKAILGSTSPEWRTVQSGYLSNILDAMQGANKAGPQAMTTILDNVFKGGRQFADVMLPQQATQMLDQYRMIMRRLSPLPGSTNPSGTAYHLAGMAKTLFSGLAALAGHHVAGPVGLIAGAASHQLGPMLTSGIHGRAAARMLYGNAATPMFAPNASASNLEQLLTRAARAAPLGR